MFFGIPEQTSETGDCSEIVREFCKSRLDMEHVKDIEDRSRTQNW
jgi:hypothetical protein